MESVLSHQQLLEAYGLAFHIEHDTETPTLFLQKELYPKERRVNYTLSSSVLWVLKHFWGHCETQCKRNGKDESFCLEVYELICNTGQEKR